MALLLKSTTQKVQVVTGDAGDLRVKCGWLHNNGGTVTPDSDSHTITTATTADVVAAPGASQERNVKEIECSNEDPVAQPLTVQYTDGTDTVPLWEGSLLQNEKVVFDETGQWTLYDAQGLPKNNNTATAEAFLTTAQSISAATYADLTGVSITLDPGTWLILGVMHMSAANLAFLGHLAITDSGNTIVAEGSQGAAASGTASVHQWASIHLSVVVAPVAQTTYKLRAARGLTTLTNSFTAQDGGGTNVTNNASTNNDKGTGIRAIRLR